MNDEYLRKMIDEFGYRVLIDAARCVYDDSVPEHRQNECMLVGQYIVAMRAAQREYERSIVEPV